jgi:hypothetical protein
MALLLQRAAASVVGQLQVDYRHSYHVAEDTADAGIRPIAAGVELVAVAAVPCNAAEAIPFAEVAAAIHNTDQAHS